MQKKIKSKRKIGRKGRPIKIPASFDRAIDALIAAADSKPIKKQGRQ